MPNCTNPPGNNSRLHAIRGREQLAMSIIVEEPASMRESRLNEQEKHPMDIKPSSGSFLETLEEHPRDSARLSTGHPPASPASRSEPVKQSRSAFSATSAVPSSIDERCEYNATGTHREARAKEPSSRHLRDTRSVTEPAKASRSAFNSTSTVASFIDEGSEYNARTGTHRDARAKEPSSSRQLRDARSVSRDTRSASEPDKPSRSASSSTSTAPSSIDEGYECNPRAGTHREARVKEPSSSRHMRDPRSASRTDRSEPEYTPRSKSSNSSSSSEEEAYDRHRRPPRRDSSRPKASSIPPSKGSSSSTHERRQPHPSGEPSRGRSKSSTRLDSIHTPPSDRYEYPGREPSRQPSRPRSRSRDRCLPESASVPIKDKNGVRQLPPFRLPHSQREKPRPEQLPRLSSGSPDQERRQRRMSSRQAASELDRATLASLSETEMYEDRRMRAFREVSPPPRQRSTSNPKPMARTHVGTGQRQFASCRESKTPVTMNPKLMMPSKDRQTAPGPFLSSREPTRTRSTSLLPKKSKPASSDEAIPRSVSASSLSSLGSAPRMDAPLRLRHYEGRFLNQRKQTLFYFSLFPPEKMAMRGVVLSLHGIGDHCRRNVKLYERLCRGGFGVITYDFINHGVSDLDQHKTRAHISNFSDLVEDTNTFISFAKRTIYADALRYWRKKHHPKQSSSDKSSLPELPLVIAGTSFGSLIGLHTVLSGKHKFSGAVWGSPTVGVTWNPLLWAESKLAKPLAAIIPTAKMVPAIQHDRLCRDPKFLRKFKADPLTSMDMMTASTGHESLQAMTQLQDDKRVGDSSSAFCAVPTLFLAGSADAISDQQAALKFFGTMGNFDKEFKLFDGLFHMVYEEPEKEDVFRYLAKWLQRRFPLHERP